jgi:1-deoxy-D-xylulose-5-phosphate synthase
MANHPEAVSKVTGLGIPDRFIEQGKTGKLYHECGYDTEGITKAIINLVKTF